ENQPETRESIEKVPGWSEKGTRLLHKKIMYLLSVLILATKAIKLEQLMNWMDYKNKKTFRDNYLGPLQVVEFVRKTIPDNPSSPEQQYIITEKGKLFLTGRDV
ncbi:MAG: hypothetical protein JXJ04_17435, partial [Spirochaetales bacterium]|nr:hypothetical protein [Spirochaetales bacterium]